MFSAVLDTCVLWPSVQRDLLLSLSVEGLYRPLWGSAILAELEYHERAKLRSRGIPEQQAVASAQRLIATMTREFDDSLVTGWEGLEGTFGLPDPDDEHVVAVAVVAGADVIVTSNIKDIPATMIPSHVDVQTPQEFLANTVTVDPRRAATAVRAMVGRYRKPALTVGQLLDILETRYGLAEAVDVLRAIG